MLERYAISGRLDISTPGRGEPDRAAGAGLGLVLEEATPLHAACARFEQAYIRRALDACGGSVAKAAERLGIHRSLLYKKLKKTDTV